MQCKPGSDFLRPGEFLAKGQSLVSPNGLISATLQPDGDFVVTSRNSLGKMTLWATGTKSDSVTRLCFGLVPRQLNLYGSGAQVRWSPQPGREYGADHVLRVGNDGNLAILPESASPLDYGPQTIRAWTAGASLPVEGGQSLNNTLMPGQSLGPNQNLSSTNGKYTLNFNKGGELCITTVAGHQPSVNFAWSPRGDEATRTNAAILAFTSDGFLELKDSTGAQVWKVGPGQGSQAGRPAGFCMRDDGRGVVHVVTTPNTAGTGTNDVLWELPQPVGDRIVTGQTLNVDQRLRSRNGAYDFVVQGDRNIVLYKFNKPDPTRPSDHQPIWASNTWRPSERPDRLILQTDGNLVGYQGGARNVGFWSTRTVAAGGATVKRVLVLQDDGDVVLMEEGGKVVWSTGTKGR